MKKILISLLFIMIIIVGCNDNNISSKPTLNNNEGDVIIKSMNVVINDEKYIIDLEDNVTVKELIKLLPIDLTMNELNGNEKYVYLDTKFTKETYSPKYINAGDVMLYGNNCLVIFYKSFNTSYEYTKIGHIDNLPDLGSDKINVRFEIEEELK